MVEEKKEEKDSLAHLRLAGEETVEELKEKISFLQEEIARRDTTIEQLREENKMIMQTAIRNAQKHAQVEHTTKKHDA